MRVSQLILDKIKNDRVFRQHTALALGVTERNVELLGLRKSDNLTKYNAVKFYKSTGLKEEEIFEVETPYKSFSNN